LDPTALGESTTQLYPAITICRAAYLALFRIGGVDEHHASVRYGIPPARVNDLEQER
jgi:hypothetical protein